MPALGGLQPFTVHMTYTLSRQLGIRSLTVWIGLISAFFDMCSVAL